MRVGESDRQQETSQRKERMEQLFKGLSEVGDNLALEIPKQIQSEY